MKIINELIKNNNKELEIENIFNAFKKYSYDNNLKYLSTNDFIEYIKNNNYNIKLRKNNSTDEDKNLITLFHGKMAAIDLQFDIQPNRQKNQFEMELNFMYFIYIDHNTYGSRTTLSSNSAFIDIFLNEKELDFKFFIEEYRDAISIANKDYNMNEAYSEPLKLVMNNILSEKNNKLETEDILLLNYDFDSNKNEYYEKFYNTINDLYSYAKKIKLANTINNKKNFKLD